MCFYCFLFRYCSQYYNLKSSFSKDKIGRAPSFGIGERIKSFRSTGKIPPVGKYEQKSQFEQNAEKNTGYTFGINRGYYEKVYNEANQPN